MPSEIPAPARLGSAMIAFALVAAGCSLGRDSSKPMQLKVLEGNARVVRAGEQPEIVRSEAGVRTGDRIVVSRGGLAQLRLAEGRAFELAGAEVRVSSPSTLVLKRGLLLAELSARGSVDAETVSATSSKGAFRIDSRLSIRVASYEGGVSLSSPGQKLTLPRLRQVVVAGGMLPGREQPLRVDRSDRWDRRYLQQVIDFDARLSNFGRGLEAQLGSAAGGPLFLRVLPSAGDLGFLAPYLSQRRSDVLIGLVISSEAAGSRGVSVGGVFPSVFALWSEGASWGLIAFENGIGEQKLFSGLLDALRRTGFRISAGGSLGGPPQVPGPRDSGGGGTGRPTGPSPLPSPRPSPSPSPITGVEPVDDILDEVIDILPSPPLL